MRAMLLPALVTAILMAVASCDREAVDPTGPEGMLEQRGPKGGCTPAEVRRGTCPNLPPDSTSSPPPDRSSDEGGDDSSGPPDDDETDAPPPGDDDDDGNSPPGGGDDDDTGSPPPGDDDDTGSPPPGDDDEDEQQPPPPPTGAFCEASGSARCWYVAANASSGGNGSFEAPFRLPQDAADRARPGDYVYLRGAAQHGEFRRGTHGTHLITHAGRDHTTVNGEPNRPIVVKSYPGEQAVARGVLSGGIPTADRYGVHIIRSYWRVEGLRFINGGIRIGNDIGSRTRGVRIEDNHLSDYFCNIGNCGIISLSGQAHGQDPSSDPTQDSRDIWIIGNTVHALWGMQPDGSGPVAWHNNVDVEHHACFAGFAFYRDIHVYGNTMYHCPSVIYFKWTSPGPIFIDGNDFGPVRAFGRSRAQDVRCGQNNVSVLLSNTFRYADACN